MHKTGMAFVSVLFFTVSACGPGSDQAKFIEEVNQSPVISNDGETLPLEKRVFRDDETDQNNLKIKHDTLAFGNWLASCTRTHFKSSGTRRAECEILPWAGQTMSDDPIPTLAGPVIRMTDTPEGRLLVRLPERSRASEVSFGCGLSEIVSNTSSGISIPEKQQSVFISRMITRDCVITYVPENSTDAVTATYISNGFSEAHDFAREYVVKGS